MSIARLKRDNTLLLVIDFQERLMPAMDNKEDLEDKMVKMAKGARVMGIPVLVSQQYTKGLGPTIPSIAEALGEFEAYDKTSFSVMGQPDLAEALRAANCRNIVITGIESHICVQQSALDLLEEGYNVFVAADCVSSRKKTDARMAKSRMRAAGAVYTTMEAVLFELCGGAREPGFKEISAIIK